MECKGPLILPYNIYCLVVDMVAADDSNPWRGYTLCACALTSPAWVSCAHFHLYRRVVLPTRNALLGFTRTITHSPQQFTPLIKHIDIKVSPAHDCGWPRNHRQVAIPFPPHAVTQMANLKSVRFTSSFQFAEAPASLVAFVRAFAACGALRKVALHRFFFPQFRELVVTVWSFERMAPLVIFECGWCTLRSGLELPDANAYPVRCHNLNNLLVSKCSATMPILDVVRTSIHEITLWTHGDTDQCHAISAFTSLRKIAIVFCTLQWPITLLAHVRSEHVRELKMKLSVDCLSNDELVEEAVLLDDLLSRAPFDGLRRLTVVAFWADARRGQLHHESWVQTVVVVYNDTPARSV
ncbi:hypothetical protein LXA43DRAFT_1098811 [Ganoderma leucocontextum]|nr:hypothetical protein LXA43DRAFT_1098811 [Ganoderma leucocontextum]